MRRTFACTAALALLLVAPALAKGPSEATITGPGLPILSRLKALRMTFEIWVGTVTSSTHLVTEA